MAKEAKKKLPPRKRERAMAFLRSNLEEDAVTYGWNESGELSLMFEAAEKWIDGKVYVPTGLDGDPLRIFMLRFAHTVSVKRMHDMVPFVDQSWFQEALKESKKRYPPPVYPPA